MYRNKDKNGKPYGNWLVRIGGRRLSTGTPDKKLAREIEATLRVQHIEGTHDLKRKADITIYQLQKKYMRSLVDTRGNPEKFSSKKRGIQSRIDRHILPTFANRRVMDLSQEDILDWLRSIKAHRPDGLRRIMSVLRAMINWGLENPKKTRLRYSPIPIWPKFDGKQLPRIDQDKWTTLTVKEVEQVVKGDHPEYNLIKPMVLFALYNGGMRLSNVAGLLWRELDLDHKLVRVKGAKTKAGKPLWIPLLPMAEAVVMSQAGKHPTHVFVNSRGEPWYANSVSRLWRNSKRHIGINRHVRFHDLRHTFASHAAMQGFTDEEIAEMLSVTPEVVKRYRHFRPEYIGKRFEAFSYKGRIRADQRNISDINAVSTDQSELEKDQ